MTASNKSAVATRASNVFANAGQPVATYLAKQDSRQRFSFGNTWMCIVLSGVVQDRAKLVAHGVKLGLGKAYDLSVLKHDTLVARVQAALMAA